MKNLESFIQILLPLLLVVLALRVSLEAVMPTILPLCGVAFVGLVVWLWLYFKR